MERARCFLPCFFFCRSGQFSRQFETRFVSGYGFSRTEKAAQRQALAAVRKNPAAKEAAEKL
jgi:hypothetical protein